MASQQPTFDGQAQAEADASSDQAQLHRDAAASTTQQPAQNPGIIEQTENSVKTMAHGAAIMAGGAASGVMGLAQGAATGAANLAEGAAGAVKNTFGSSNQVSQNQQ